LAECADNGICLVVPSPHSAVGPLQTSMGTTTADRINAV